ncbi:MAG: hypothetical protein Q4B70_16800, partial [Lachnospiraceae bacterium]|nr:hypothetical protein [Lachnospiraceae bacterium]
EFIRPYLELEITAAQELGIQISDGGIWGETKVPKDSVDGLLDFVTFASGGITMVFDPDLEKIGPKYFRDYADKAHSPLAFGISTSFLQSASVEEVVERVKRYTLVGKTGITPCLVGFS